MSLAVSGTSLSVTGLGTTDSWSSTSSAAILSGSDDLVSLRSPPTRGRASAPSADAIDGTVSRLRSRNTLSNARGVNPVHDLSCGVTLSGVKGFTGDVTVVIDGV